MLKHFVKNIFWKLGIDVTQNMKYDRQTEKVIRKVLQQHSSTVDVGCHKGEMLVKFIQRAPQGKHYGFEPIPSFYEKLKQQFENARCKIYPYALAAEAGETEFNYVQNAPAYSGLKQREYAIEHPDIKKIKVVLKRMDEVIDINEKIDLIKIDVEGAELGVLQGAAGIIQHSKPVIIFECGLGASEFYGTKPEMMYDLLVNDFGLKLSTMQAWLKQEKALSREAFCERYYSRRDYYFMAYP